MHRANNETGHLFCNCTGTFPWPSLAALSAGAPNGYYVCRECGAVCEQVRRPDGSAAQTRWYDSGEWDGLPPQVKQQARRLLEQIEPDMLPIPAGEFWIGSSDADLTAALAGCDDTRREWYRGEQPRHAVYLPGYLIARTPVTNAQYNLYIKATGSSVPAYWQNGRPPFGQEEHPVVGLSWHEAMAYCRWLTFKTAKPYDLPSEAEWEKAARGTDARLYPWGNEFGAFHCNCCEIGLGMTLPVDAFPGGASPYGVLDMSGNVWEWTQSLYQPYPYEEQNGRESLPAQGLRVLRGGAFYYNRFDVRCTVRSRYAPDRKSPLVGFRPVLRAG